MGLMRRITGMLLLCVATIVTASAQATATAEKHQRAAVFVPFVGCPSFGQVERLEAPNDTSRPVPISSTYAQALAYYRSADGIGILAPRGWFCEGALGSGGAALYLTPKPIQHDGSGFQGRDGPAIEVHYLTGGSSGIYGIAEVMARVFPAYRAFASLTGLISVILGQFEREATRARP
jgi:hypothetical protein